MKIHNYMKPFVNLSLDCGFRVFIAERGHYGFITNKDGSVIMSAAVDGLRFNTSGCYSAVLNSHANMVGQGWGISENWPQTKAELKALFEQAKTPPRWATRGCAVKLKTMIDHLEVYQKSSRYVEVLEVLL